MMGWELLPNLPYSQDLKPNNCHHFGPLKESLQGLEFKDKQDVQQQAELFQFH